MAIDKSMYKNKIKTSLWANDEFNIFFYYFKSDTKQYKGLINLSDQPNLNKKERIYKAENELIRIREEKKLNKPVNDDITLDKYIVNHFKRRKQNNTLKDYKSFYNSRIKPKIGHRKLKDILPMEIRDIIANLQDIGLSASRQKVVLDVLRPMFKEALENRLIVFDPTANITIKMPPTKKIVTNAKDELARISTAIDNEFGDDPFYHAFFLFALQGRRKSEILNLKWEDINFEANYYILRNTKNNEEQRMFLPSRIKELLLEFKDDKWIYVFHSHITGERLRDAKRAILRLKKKLGFKKQFGIHYFRNVISSAMAEDGMESIYLSGALGHKDPNTIKKYLTLNYLQSSEKANSVIEKITNK